jgi:UvrD-like helicase C-terminal domain/AAA domain
MCGGEEENVAHALSPAHGDNSNCSAAGMLAHLLRSSLRGEYRVIQGPVWFTTDDDGFLRRGAADLVVVHPQHGALVLAVQDSRVSTDAHFTRWYAGDQHGATRQIENPFERAASAARVLDETLRRAAPTDPYAWQYSISHGVWLPHTQWARGAAGVERLLQGMDARVLDAGDLYWPEGALLRLYQVDNQQWRPPQLSEEAIAALVALLEPTDAVKSSLARDIAGEATHIQQLTEAQQQRLIAMWHARRQLAVSGPAGTGKTVLAIEMAWRLAEQGLDVLFLCANQVLADWLRERLRDDPIPDKPHFTIHSLKSLGAYIARLAGQSGVEIERLRIESSEDQKLLAGALARGVRAMEQRGARMPYDAILVDEGQDVERPVWGPIQDLLRDRREGFFYVFYDEAQRVDYDERWAPQIRPPIESAPLTVNCRNTRAIYQAMAQLNPELNRYPFEGPEGRPVEFIDPRRADVSLLSEAADTETMALEIALDRLTGPQGGLRPEDILVISCRSEAAMRWRTKQQRLIGEHALSWIRCAQAGHVSLATIRSAKGLECKAVVLAELDGLDHEKRREALLYVAISRAMHHLIVLGAPRDIQSRKTSKVTSLLAAVRPGH